MSLSSNRSSSGRVYRLVGLRTGSRSTQGKLFFTAPVLVCGTANAVVDYWRSGSQLSRSCRTSSGRKGGGKKKISHSAKFGAVLLLVKRKLFGDLARRRCQQLPCVMQRCVLLRTC